jgi:hypothetical protein
VTNEPPRAPGEADATPYTADELRVIRAAYADGAVPACPRCGGALSGRRIGGGSFGLGYARRREWLICAGCHRSALFDLRRGTRN